MKREVLCRPCGVRVRRAMPSFEGEHTKFLSGWARRSFYCDACGNPIQPGDPAVAFSAWTDYGGIPYYPWEPEYLSDTRAEAFS